MAHSDLNMVLRIMAFLMEFIWSFILMAKKRLNHLLKMVLWKDFEKISTQMDQ